MLEKKFCPTWYYQNINEIDLKALANLGKKVILCDLDNTIVAFFEKTPSKLAVQFIENSKNNGFMLCIVSNNTSSRVAKFCEEHQLIFLHSTQKPFTHRVKKFLKEKNIEVKNCVFIGDQILTDIWMANKLQMDSILVEPVSSKDLIFTRFNRMIDKKFRTHYSKKNQLKKLGEK